MHRLSYPLTYIIYMCVFVCVFLSKKICFPNAHCTWYLSNTNTAIINLWWFALCDTMGAFKPHATTLKITLKTVWQLSVVMGCIAQCEKYGNKSPLNILNTRSLEAMFGCVYMWIGRWMEYLYACGFACNVVYYISIRIFIYHFNHLLRLASSSLIKSSMHDTM